TPPRNRRTKRRVSGARFRRAPRCPSQRPGDEIRRSPPPSPSVRPCGRRRTSSARVSRSPRLLYSAPRARLFVESEHCSLYQSPPATSARASRFPSSSPKSSSSDHRRGLSAAALRCRQYSGRVANENVEVARSYHERTKHSEERLRANPHHLAWDNLPVPFKLYRELEAIPLPRQLEPGTVSA